MDHGGSIDFKEFLDFMSAGVHGLCKILNINTNVDGKIYQYSIDMFKKIDTDNGGDIGYEEFEYWIKGDKDLQEFVLKYTGVQTFDHATSRF